MEENILIKSEVDKKIKSTLLILSVSLLAFCAISCIFLAFDIWVAKYYVGGYYLGKYYVQGYWDYTVISGYEVVFDGDYIHATGLGVLCITWFSLASLSFVVGLPLFIAYLAMQKCSLEVTDKSVRGKAFFGKEVILPMYMVSAYSTRKLFSTISVATSSGITKFALIKNCVEIGNVLSAKINERQDSTASSVTVTTQATQSNSMEDLKKLKDLLDAGIITQEEFDAKKKQLLGL